MYLVIEGVDGSGKSTLVETLAAKFKARTIREPGTGAYGEGLRELMLNTKGLSDTTLLLGMLSARSNCLDEVKQYRDVGYPVISDRGALSTYVYQCSSLENEKLFFETYRALMPQDIIYVVLDIDYATYRKRRPEFDDELEAAKCCNDISFNDLRERYRFIGRRFNAIHVDATQSESEVFDEVYAKILERLND